VATGLRLKLAGWHSITVMAWAAVLTCMPASALAQDLQNDGGTASSSQPAISNASFSYVPITPAGRIKWVVNGTVGPRSLGVGVIAAAWQTGLDTPEEWGSWTGFGRRYMAREADVALSNTLEAGVGAFWGEEPRYIRSHRHGVWPRTRYAMKTVFLAQRRDGHLAPAWGRYVGNVVNNVIENAYMPHSVTTAGQTAIRSGDGFLGRLVGNLFDEFWPDAERWLRHRRR
jgi:hypothetical protein